MTRPPRWARSLGPSLAMAWLCAVGGCRPEPASSSPDPEAVAGWPTVPDGGYAVLPRGTWVYVEPRFGAPAGRLGWPEATRAPWPSSGRVVRIVGARDGFVAISPVGSVPIPSGEETHCEDPLFADRLDVTLYVPPQSLATVLTHEHTVSFDDGTSASLVAGAVVKPIDDDPRGRHAVALGSIRLRLRLPPDAIGYRYDEASGRDPRGSSAWVLSDDLPLSYDGGWPLERDPVFPNDVMIDAVTPQGPGFLVLLRGRCETLQVLTDREPRQAMRFDPDIDTVEFGLGAPQVQLPPGFDVGLGEGSSEPEPRFHFPDEEGLEGELLTPSEITLLERRQRELRFEQGAPVYLSPHGPASGTLGALRIFDEPRWGVGDRLCFETSFGRRFEPLLPVCLDVEEGTEVQPEDLESGIDDVILTPGPVEIEGALEPAAVARALRRHRPQLRRCYVQALRSQPRLRGRLALGLDVDGDGRVTQVDPRQIPPSTLAACVIPTAKRWTMPAPTDGKPARVDFEVTLGPQDDDDGS